MLRRVAIPFGGTRLISAGASPPSIRWSSSAAASYAMPSRSCRTLESGVLIDSQSMASLSTPSTATSSGTAMPSWSHAAMMSAATQSL